MKIQIEYACFDDLVREVCETCERVYHLGRVLRCHPSLHDWILDYHLNAGEMRKPILAWRYPITRGTESMTCIWELTPLPERGP